MNDERESASPTDGTAPYSINRERPRRLTPIAVGCECLAGDHRVNKADGTQTLIHEFTQALLHFDVDDGTEQPKHEVEAEAVAYVVRRYFRLNTSDSAFYLTAWKVEFSRRSRATRPNQRH